MKIKMKNEGKGIQNNNLELHMNIFLPKQFLLTGIYVVFFSHLFLMF